ncbi:MAG: outer membrane beta-barrel protein [Bacteroidales bacterium]|nr:outer membrane beta-barrel protein [Bacteroidales bacterium]
MNDRQFDEIVRQKLESFRADDTEALWAGIQTKMAARRRRRFFVRISSIAASAAAVIALALLVFKDNDTKINTERISSVAIAEQIEDVMPAENIEIVEASSSDIATATTPMASETADASVPLMQEQLKKFANATAQAEPENVKTAAAIVEQEQTQISETLAAESEANVAEKAEIISEAIKTESPATTISEPASVNLWDDNLFANEEQPQAKRHITLAAATNAAQVKKNGGIAHAPAYTASAVGGYSNLIEETTTPRYSLPISFGLQSHFDLGKGFALGVGLQYSYLECSFDALVNKVYYKGTSNQLHYVGLNFNGYYDILQHPQFKIYARAGFLLDRLVYGRYVYESKVIKHTPNGVQLSANIGVGFEYDFLDFMGIYIEPMGNYFFNNNQPKSIRTEHPFIFSAEAGFRFRL